jgi:hypothetical protein
MIVYEHGIPLSFSEFCLSESIKPSETSYGINYGMNDGDIVQSASHYHTFFQFDGIFYLVTLLKRTGTIGFAVSKNHSLYPSDYSDDRHQTRNALKVFGHVMYVAFELISFLNPPYVKFERANPALGAVYDRMVKNKFVLSYIDNAGYHYEGKNNDVHIFRRK